MTEQDDFSRIYAYLKGDTAVPVPPLDPVFPKVEPTVVDEPLIDGMEIPDFVKFSLIKKLMPLIPMGEPKNIAQLLRDKFHKTKINFIREHVGKTHYQQISRTAYRTELPDFYEFSKKQKSQNIAALADEDSLSKEKLENIKFEIEYWSRMEEVTERFVNEGHLNA
jgi:hypothetical protein